MTPLVGFFPDADMVTPGLFSDCMNVIPTDAGYGGAPTARATTVAALAAQCRGAVVATKLDGTRRLFAGSQTKLYELSSTTWTDRSAGGGSYTGSTESRWSFCQFGDTTIASNLVDAMQSTVTGAFAAVAGSAPKAKIVVSASNNFVLAFYTNEGTYGVSPDRWWCCAQNNQADWVPSVSTSANTGRLIASEGPLTAALTLGDYVVAYKGHALWVGSYVGAPEVWRFVLVPGSDCGAVGQDAVCSIGTAHFIVGEDDFWLFDGTRPQSIGEGIRNWFRANSSQTYRYRTRVAYDRQRNIVWVNFPSNTSTGDCDRTIVYHVGRKKWGRADFTGEAFLSFVAPGVTIDGLDAYSSTIDGLPPIPFDSQYWLAGGRAMSYFNTAHTIVVNDGATGASSIVTGDLGDDDTLTTLERFRMRYKQSPAAASATDLYVMNEGDSYTPGDVAVRFDGRHDFHNTARWHRVYLAMTGDHEETGYDLKLTPEAEQ